MEQNLQRRIPLFHHGLHVFLGESLKNTKEYELKLRLGYVLLYRLVICSKARDVGHHAIRPVLSE